MSKPKVTSKDYRCICGRPSEVEVDGEYLCWELYLINEPWKWQAKYQGQKSRHLLTEIDK